MNFKPKKGTARMKKRLIALFLIISMLSLSSCSYIEGVRQMIKDMREINSAKRYGYDESGNADYVFDRDVIKTIDERFDKLDEMLKENDESRAGAFTAMFNLQMNDLYYLADHSSIAFTQFCTDPNNEEYAAFEEELSKLLNDRSARLYRMYETVYNSNMSSVFYDSWSKEDIDRALELSKQSTEEYVEMKDVVDEYVQKYEQLDRDGGSFNTSSAELYEKIVNKNREIAKSVGYDSYADYAYKEIYKRDFTPKDVTHFHQYVKDYIIPLGKSLLKDLRSGEGISGAMTGINAMETLNLSKSQLVSALEPYYTKLGKDDLDAFNSFLENYKSVSDKNARDIAFTYYMNYYGHPSCYFGPTNQSLMTFLHEQGHYLSFYKSNSNVNSFDLCESQSQSNEWLYLAYSKDSYTSDTFRTIAKYKLVNELLSVVLCACCDLFEQKVYADPTLKAKDYDGVFKDAMNELGAKSFLENVMSGKPEEYWHKAIVSNSFYYISYAISLIPVFELFVIADTDGFDAAANIYNKMTVCEIDDGFTEKLTDSGLTSPFKEELYKKIRDHFI